MNSFDNSIARMKALYTYGQTNENKSQSNSTLEYSAKAADGKTYGIVKECNHFYIKQAVDGKENIAEGYNYIGGYMNKNNYRYDSYNNALKNFELKLASINEAHDAKVDVTTLDPFKKENIIAEASDKMKAEIARQRQIMYNASMIMNESCDYAVKGGKACSTSQPEAETGAKGDKAEGSKDAKANPDYKGSHISLDKKAEPFKENPGKGVNEAVSATDTDFDEGMNKGQDPANIGWDMEGQEKVNEEGEKEWDKGLPSSAGVGEADTDHNNDPFNKSVNEGAEDEPGDDVEGEEDVDLDVNSDVEGEDELDDVDDFGFDEEDDIDLDGDDLDIDFDEDLEGEDELGNEEDVDVEGEEDVDLGADGELGDEPVDESDPESIRSEIERLQSLLNNLEGGDEDVDLEGDVDVDVEGDVDVDGEDVDFEGEEDIDLGADDELGDDTDFDEGVGDEEGSFEGEEDFDDEPMHESKKQFMNRIVESVVRDMLKEDELHDFGKHPGYRKKPMTLPPTGEDKNEHGEDWNDESVHSEEPFGKQIGDSSPFNQLVNAVTKDVMYQLKHGVQLDNKKKAE